MCRAIHPLHHFEPPASPEEIHAAALQYVRKVSGMRAPSRANAEAFEQAVRDIAQVTERLLGELEAHGPPRDREEEARKGHARWAQRESR